MKNKKAQDNSSNQSELNELLADVRDLWEQTKAYVVVPTNGDVNQKGLAVMGRGVARQAALNLPKLPMLLGRRLLNGNRVQVFSSLRLVTFPVKNHYNEKASLLLIEESLAELADVVSCDAAYYGERIK